MVGGFYWYEFGMMKCLRSITGVSKLCRAPQARLSIFNGMGVALAFSDPGIAATLNSCCISLRPPAAILYSHVEDLTVM